MDTTPNPEIPPHLVEPDMPTVASSGSTPSVEPSVAAASIAVPIPVKLSPALPIPSKRKIMLRRFAAVLGISYAVILLAIFAWALFVGQNEITVFKYLPITQSVWGDFLLKLFNIMMGILVGAGLLSSLFGFLKSLLIKKEEVDKKKRASRLALWGGLGFFLLTVAWLAGIWFLGPRLVEEQRYGSPIVTTPASPLNLTTPVEVSFDASQIPVDPDVYKILSYLWEFGDGESGNGMSIAHTYTQKAEGDGIYTVKLTVKYMDLKSGQQFEDEYKTQVGISNEQTAAAFTANPGSGEIPLEVHFDATASFDPDGEIVSYEWDMDNDGKYDDATGEETDFTFTLEGDYIVSLRVTDNSGEYSTISETIEAGSIDGLRAIISTSVGENGTYYVGEDYEFSGERSEIGSGKITKYSWNFGDGSKSVQSRTVSHSFTKAGVYKVTLSVQDPDGNTDQTELELTVTEEGNVPVAAVSTLPAMSSGMLTGPLPLEVDFNAGLSVDADDDIVDYEWDFDNDGAVDDTGSTVTHLYETEGTFVTLLIVTDSVGNKDELEIPVTVTAQGIVANLEIDQSNGEVPLTVRFDASGSSYKEGNIVSYEYNFGDGSESYVTGSSVSYKYNDVGNYHATVTVLGSDGKTATDSVEIVVRPVALTACFTLNTASGTAPLFVAVDPSCSTGTISTYVWNFGDGVLSYDHKPDTHSYTIPGTYTISLEITNPEGIVSDFENTVTVK